MLRHPKLLQRCRFSEASEVRIRLAHRAGEVRDVGVGSIGLELLSTCSTRSVSEFIFTLMMDSCVFVVSDTCHSISDRESQEAFRANSGKVLVCARGPLS